MGTTTNDAKLLSKDTIHLLNLSLAKTFPSSGNMPHTPRQNPCEDASLLNALGTT